MLIIIAILTVAVLSLLIYCFLYKEALDDLEKENQLLKRVLQDYFHVQDSGQAAYEELLRETAKAIRNSASRK